MGLATDDRVCCTAPMSGKVTVGKMMRHEVVLHWSHEGSGRGHNGEWWRGRAREKH